MLLWYLNLLWGFKGKNKSSDQGRIHAFPDVLNIIMTLLQLFWNWEMEISPGYKKVPSSKMLLSGLFLIQVRILYLSFLVTPTWHPFFFFLFNLPLLLYGNTKVSNKLTITNYENFSTFWPVCTVFTCSFFPPLLVS